MGTLYGNTLTGSYVQDQVKGSHCKTTGKHLLCHMPAQHFQSDNMHLYCSRSRFEHQSLHPILAWFQEHKLAYLTKASVTVLWTNHSFITAIFSKGLKKKKKSHFSSPTPVSLPEWKRSTWPVYKNVTERKVLLPQWKIANPFPQKPLRLQNTEHIIALPRFQRPNLQNLTSAPPPCAKKSPTKLYSKWKDALTPKRRTFW